MVYFVILFILFWLPYLMDWLSLLQTLRFSKIRTYLWTECSSWFFSLLWVLCVGDFVGSVVCGARALDVLPDDDPATRDHPLLLLSHRRQSPGVSAVPEGTYIHFIQTYTHSYIGFGLLHFARSFFWKHLIQPSVLGDFYPLTTGVSWTWDWPETDLRLTWDWPETDLRLTWQ